MMSSKTSKKLSPSPVRECQKNAFKKVDLGLDPKFLKPDANFDEVKIVNPNVLECWLNDTLREASIMGVPGCIKNKAT